MTSIEVDQTGDGSDPPRRPKGSLIIVGSGIRVVGHITLEAAAEIRSADEVLYLVTSSLTERWIREQNSAATSLAACYEEGQDRFEVYRKIVDTILEALRREIDLCVVFYGHPGVFVWPSHEAIRRARAEGFKSRMLPGISSEDCLFADLDIDPGQFGCQSYEASDFLLHRRIFDTSSLLILWQVGVIGESRWLTGDSGHPPGLTRLVERLCEAYPSTHAVTIYEAARYPIREPLKERISLAELGSSRIPMSATLVVPPCIEPCLDAQMHSEWSAKMGPTDRD